MDQWFYVWHNQQTGPCSQEQLRALIESWQLRAQDMVWKQGMANWAPIHLVPELAQFLPREPAAPAPPSPAAPYYPQQPHGTEGDDYRGRYAPRGGLPRTLPAPGRLG
jgi:hypothetical protein